MSAISLARWLGRHTRGVFAVFVSMLALLGGVSACKTQARPTANQKANMKTVVIPVEGMSCAACTARIKKSLASIDGVGEVEVKPGGAQSARPL